MPCGTMQAQGSSYSYIRHAMCGEEEVTAEKEGVSIYDVMNRLVEQSPAGSERTCIPSISCGGEKSEMESGCIGKFSRNPDGA